MTSFHGKVFDEGTQLKLEIFRSYIREWLPVFLTEYRNSRPNFGKVNLFDFFAGPGHDKAGNPGSPLIIIEELKQFCLDRSAQKASVDIQLLFNDASTAKIDGLKAQISKIACSRGCCYINYSALPFSAALEANMITIRDGKEVTPEVVQQLASCRATDILFFISSSYLRRFAEAPEFAGKLDFEVDRMRNVDFNNVHKFVCEHFRQTLGGQTYYLAPFSIRKGGNIYGVIFASSSLLGLQKFLKVCWNKDAVTGEANYNIDGDIAWAGQKSLFAECNVVTKVALFERDLRRFITDKSPTNHDVYEFTLAAGFLPRHASDLLHTMEKDGTLIVSSVHTDRPNKPGAFYLTWDEYSKNQPRIKFTNRSESEHN